MLHWALSSNRNLDSQICHTVFIGGKVMKKTNSPFSYGNETEGEYRHGILQLIIYKKKGIRYSITS